MKQYSIATIATSELTDEISDIICAVLSNIGYEGFEIKNNTIEAYIEEKELDLDALNNVIHDLPLDSLFTIEVSKLENENWNETWEKNFYQPIIIGNEVLVKSSFHKTDLNAKYTIVIDPKMSFGTGHHETTSTVLNALTNKTFEGKSVIDIGSGTGILAFYCHMRGASKIVATDFDPICIENGKENQELNNINGIEWFLGDRKVLEGMTETYDIVIANINRNILLQDMDQFSKLLKPGGTLFLSGFYKQDIPVLEAEANQHSLKIEKEHSKNNWVCLELSN